MFGAIFIIIFVIFGIVTICKNVAEDYDGRKNYRNDFTNTYMGYDGVDRDLDTGKARFFYRENGDQIMRKEESLETINVSQQKRDIEYEKAKKGYYPGRTTMYYAPSPKAPYGSRIMNGARYKDIETGEIYVVREFNRQSFYVDLKGKVVRYTDFQKKHTPDKEREFKEVAAFQKEIERAKKTWGNADYTFVGAPSSNENQLIDIWE